MACKIEIREDIEKNIAERAIGIEGMNYSIAKEKVKDINSSYGMNVISVYEGENDYTNKIKINIPQELIDKYHKYFTDIETKEAQQLNIQEQERGEYTEEQKREFFQKEESEMSKASPETISLMREFLRKIGVNINTLSNIVVNGEKKDANGVALIMQKLIQVVDGKEASALPEEAMHFAVELIQQNNPKLFQQLLKEINEYALYKDVLKTYSGEYLTKEGKPDILKLKKEAIAKVLAETVIYKAENLSEKPETLAKTENWWTKIVGFLKGLFLKSGFDQASMNVILGKEMGELTPTEETFLQKNTQEQTYDKIKNLSSQIEKRDDGYYIDGKKVPRRVTDEVKDWYNRRFKDKDLTKDEYDKAVDDLKAEKGTAGHADLEHAFSLFVDENGYLRNEPLEDGNYISQVNPNNNDMYDLLKENLQQRLNSYPEGTRFMAEITVYNPSKKIAGTIDFLVITPDSKVSVLDWKFMNLNTEKYEELPWYKVNAWRVQMQQYKGILRDNYGIHNQDFEHTRMIPILTKYTKGDKKQNILPQLESIKIGDVNIKNIKEDYLIPLALAEEKTGIKTIDVLLTKLNADYKKYSEMSVAPEEKAKKNEHLNSLFKAIRQLQMRENLAPLVYESRVLNERINRTINEYENKYKGKDGNDFSDEEKDEFSDRLDSFQKDLNTYTNLDVYLDDLFKEDASPEDKEVQKNLEEATKEARKLSAKLNNILDEFTADTVVKSEGIEHFMNPEKVIKGIGKWFSSTVTLQTKAIEFLYKKANKSLTFAAFDTLSENKRLEEIKNKYEQWAKSKNLHVKNYFDIIKKKDSNELIDEFNPEFYSTLKKKIEERDTKWIRENIDVKKYNEYLKEQLETELQRIDDRPRGGTQEENERLANSERAKARQLFNTTTTESPGWLLYNYIKLFPKENWQSNEWKELNKPENAPAKEFYDYIIERNNEYRSLGYIGAYEARTFLPFVRKGLTEKLITGGNVTLGESFFRSISVDEGDIGYGKRDPHTGKLIDVIPKYFTQELDGEVSTDLFKTMAFYNEAAFRYKYLKQIEHQMRLVLNVERNKEAISTSSFGKTEYKDGVLQFTPDNAENSKLLEDMMKGIIYGQRYIQSETFDQLLGKLGTWGKTFNEKLGIKIFPEDIENRQVSVNKVIDRINNIFQLNILGLNILSAGSNLFGGSAHSIINSGKYYTKRDYFAAEGMIFMNKFNGENKKKMLAALEYFLPLTDNYNRELAKELSVQTLTNEGLQDALMILMRHSDWNVQTANFYAYLANTIVDDGQVKNVREYLKTTDKYKNSYSLSKEERDQLAKDFEQDVKNLMEEKGVMKLATVENNELVIPGVDRKSQSVIETRRKIQQISKNALGNLTADDLRAINMSVYGKSFMIFKNWIPRLIDVRTGNLKYNSASDAYEWGRARMIFRVLSQDVFHGLGQLRNSLIANEKGVEYMRELYEKKKADYLNDTGKVLNMTEDEFMDLVRQNIKSQMTDVVFLMIMLALVAGIKELPDTTEDPAVANQYRFLARATDKFKDELMYFYNPTSFTGMISSGIFPSINLIDTFSTALKKFMIENWAIATGNEELENKTQVIKYWMKSFPFTNQMISYLPMFYPDAAKDMGIRIQKNYQLMK